MKIPFIATTKEMPKIASRMLAFPLSACCGGVLNHPSRYLLRRYDWIHIGYEKNPFNQVLAQPPCNH